MMTRSMKRWRVLSNTITPTRWKRIVEITLVVRTQWCGMKKRVLQVLRTLMFWVTRAVRNSGATWRGIPGLSDRGNKIQGIQLKNMILMWLEIKEGRAEDKSSGQFHDTG